MPLTSSCISDHPSFLLIPPLASPSSVGTFAAASDIDFYLDVDPATGAEMVIVSDTVHTRHHAEFIARHIARFEEIIRDLEAPASAVAAAATAPIAAPAPAAKAF